MISLRLTCLVLCMVSIVHVLNAQEYYTLTSTMGNMKGIVESASFDTDMVTVTKFLGIPYAEPPVGDKRFEKPVSKSSLTSTLNATQFASACIQVSNGPGVDTPTQKSEDCLFLNVFVPYNMTTGSQGSKKPVMIWLHEGGFISGESNVFDGTLLSGVGDVIVVTINYRLTYLGFMTTVDDVLPRNVGLWDQHLAIQWVHDNIASFGGDAGKVTLFGASAGATSVVYQCFYPGNIGLFKRAIAQSGSLSPRAFTDRQTSLQITSNLAQQVGCNQTSTVAMVECLKQVPSEEFSSLTSSSMLITPVFDNEFVLDTADNLLSGNSTASNAYDMFHSIDLMIGSTNADGLANSMAIMGLLNIIDPRQFTLSKDDFESTVVPTFLPGLTKGSPNEAVKFATINEYTDWSDPTSESKRAQQLTDFITEPLFSVPAVLTADLHSESSMNNRQTSTYLYEFAVRPLNHVRFVPPLLDGDDVMNHLDDVIFVFGQDIENVIADERYSYLVSTYNATITLWTNFAKSGNPNSPNDVSTLINSVWPEYTTSSKEYIKITKEMSPASIKNNPRPQAVNLWNKLIPKLLQTTPQSIPRDSKTVRVTSPVGEIIGLESYVPFSADYGFRVQSFLGIPYAKAAENDLRFQKPVAKEPFTGPFNATQYGPACYQMVLPGFNTDSIFSEDCLKVNVFVPAGTHSEYVEKKAVMIWIYGGGFSFGESNLYDPKVLTGYGDVIAVTLNYRLGYYGFMTTGDSVIPSNIGLWDQHMAIKWVHDNIAAFGGDTNRITIFGESAGAASVIYQSLYPGNKGLFQRAIAQSGINACPWAYVDLPSTLKFTREFAELTGCSLGSTNSFLKCLQDKPIDELQKVVNSLPLNINQWWTLPTRDNDFILDTPENIISGRSNAMEVVEMFNSVDLMIGYTNSEGLVFASNFLTLLGQTDFNQFSLPKSGYENNIINDMLNSSRIDYISDHLRRSVIHEYTDWTDPDSETKRAQQLVDLYTDSWYAIPSIRAANRHAQSNRNTYLYEFSVRPLSHTYPVPPFFDGPGVMNHGDDVDFVMGSYITRVSDSEEHHQQLRVYHVAMKMWSNFAKSGNPNTPVDITKYIYTSWPQYTSTREYLEITQEVTHDAVKKQPRSEALNFWTRVMPETINLSQNTGSCETSSANRVVYSSAMLVSVFVVVFSELM